MSTDAVTTSRQLRQLRALMAPLARNRGSVIDDERLLRLAREVCNALLHEDAEGGLLRHELAATLSPDLDDLFDARVDVFCELGLLQTYTPKRNQQRYVLNMAGYIGLMVAERISERGGVEELLQLLHRTAQEIVANRITEEIVAQRLIEARRVFIGFSNELRRRRETDTLRELIDYKRDHDSGQAMSEVVSLNEAVADRYSQLTEAAAALIRAAQSYTRELEAVIDRLLVEGGSARDFSLLDPADYRAAAITADLDALAQVASTLVFDIGTVPVAPAQIVDALAEYRPRTRARRRPGEPPPSSEEDPLARWAESQAQRQRRVERKADLLLGSDSEVELTDRLRGQEWRGAAKTLAELLVIHQQPGSRYRVELADSLLIDAEAPVTYFSPATLHRAASAAAEPADEPVIAEAPPATEEEAA
jgi:hypothetical protein